MIKDAFKTLLVVAVGLAAAFGLGYFAYRNYAYFNPKYEQVRRNTFEQSQAYNDGMRRDLENLQMEYAKADDAGKVVIRSTALHRFAAYDIEKLPSDLRSFYFQLKSGN